MNSNWNHSGKTPLKSSGTLPRKTEPAWKKRSLFNRMDSLAPIYTAFISYRHADNFEMGRK